MLAPAGIIAETENTKNCYLENIYILYYLNNEFQAVFRGVDHLKPSVQVFKKPL